MATENGMDPTPGKADHSIEMEGQWTPGDLQRYILEQAKIEVDHTRSWPNKVLAFYVAINFGLVGSLLALANLCTPFHVPWCGKLLIMLGVSVLFIWAARHLGKNHHSYLHHRNIQIRFQLEHLKGQRTKYSLPDDWFTLNAISLSTRWAGWGFYMYIIVLITALTIAGIWGIR